MEHLEERFYSGRFNDLSAVIHSQMPAPFVPENMALCDALLFEARHASEQRILSKEEA